MIKPFLIIQSSVWLVALLVFNVLLTMMPRSGPVDMTPFLTIEGILFINIMILPVTGFIFLLYEFVKRYKVSKK